VIDMDKKKKNENAIKEILIAVLANLIWNG